MIVYDGAGSIFFNDQYVNFKDLNNIEYTKIKTIRDSFAACIKQPGVAVDLLSESALKVEYVDSKHFTVSPGVAIDKYGRLIYVPQDVNQYKHIIDDPEYHPVYPNRESLKHGKVPVVPTRYYVNIYYNTQQDIIESDSAGVTHYTRDYDSYYIACEDFQAGSGAYGSGSLGIISGSLGISLGSFEVDNTGNIRFGAITDMRPLLEVRHESFSFHNYASGSRRVFTLSREADSSVNSVAGNAKWNASSTGIGLPGSLKANISYVHRVNANTMNIRFCALQQRFSVSQLRAYICDSAGTVVYGAVDVSATPQLYDLSLDLSGLIVDTLYYILIRMWVPFSLSSGYFELRDLVIDVD